ncbi:MAG: YjgN family protein [Sulfuricaulis sp.]|nr:YjgN family protein [Sulfuricaulis sp.]
MNNPSSAHEIAQAATAAAAVPGPPAELVTGKLPLHFTGSAAEYFRIWIVNICLTLFTIGVFSAWAKVRKKRYFYSHTLLDGTPFQYLGQPIPILKGRLIAATLFAMWYTTTHFFTMLLPVVIVAALVLAPWVVVRSAAFTARYSAFRNMRFHFTGSYLSLSKVMYGWAVITLLTLGIGYSWWHQRMKRYMANQASFGDINGEFMATGGQFFKTYMIAGLMIVPGVILVSMLFGIGIAAQDGANKTAMTVGMLIVMYSLYVMLYAYTQARITNLVWNNTRLGPARFNSTIGVRSLLVLYLTNALGILASAGLLIPWATIRTLKYRAEHFSVTSEGSLAEFRGSEDMQVRAVGSEVGELFDFDMSL